MLNLSTQEANASQIDVAIDDSAIMAKLLDYVYTSEYDGTSLVESGTSSVWLNAKLYAAADYYAIPQLKKVARAQFEQSATKAWTHDWLTNELGEMSAIINFIYENTPNEGGFGLRDTAIKIVVPCATKLFNLGESLKGLQDTTQKSGEFWRDFSIALLKKWQGFRKVQCQQCQHVWADPRPDIPDVYCPGCRALKRGWDRYQVD